MLRTAQLLPLYRAFDTGLRPDPFPDRAASLLPGLLAATRTGLPPASDDELTTKDQLHRRPPVCWAHESPGLVISSSLTRRDRVPPSRPTGGQAASKGHEVARAIGGVPV